MGGAEGYKIQGTKIISPYPVELTPGERRLLFSLQRFFAPDLILADYYLPKTSKIERIEAGRVVTTANLLQIDVLAIDERGVFVFESKDYVGWIYGHGDRVHWTQVSGYGKNKHQFYSPVKQNARHVEAVRTVVGEDTPIYSVIVFGRETTLKVVDGLSENCLVCTQVNIGTRLAQIQPTKVLSKSQINDVKHSLMAGRIVPDRNVRTEHIAEVESYDRKLNKL